MALTASAATACVARFGRLAPAAAYRKRSASPRNFLSFFWRNSLSVAKDSTAFAAMTNGGSASPAELHGAYCHAPWRFGLFLEAKVAVELAEFLQRYDESQDGFWTAVVDGRVEGSITVDGL